MKKHLKQENRLWDYAIVKKLGQGTSGEVFLVKHKVSNEYFALKKMPLTTSQQHQKLHAFKQINFLSLLDHPSLIGYHQSFLSMDHIYVVMEYASKGDLLKLIEERKKKERFFTQNELWTLFEQIIAGMKYLHEKGVIHRDLKVENIFMTKEGKVKIGDLGMAKVMLRNDQLLSTRIGTPIYFAPEMILNQMYSFPVDIWSLGCVFYYLAAFQHPFNEATMQTLSHYVIQRPLKPIKGQYSIQMINFINSCFEKDPKKRPSIFELGIKIKNRNQSQTHRCNRISIFNIKQLNRILVGQNSLRISQRKIKTQREIPLHSQNSSRKTYTSNTHRDYKQKDQQQMVTKDRKIRTSFSGRIFRDNFLLKSPENPSIGKKRSYYSKQRINEQKILVANDNKNDLIQSPLIKSNGFSLHVSKKMSQQTDNQEREKLDIFPPASSVQIFPIRRNMLLRKQR